MNVLDKEKWDLLFPAVENPHILQSYEWGELKSHFGWEPWRLEHNGIVFQILMKKLPFGLKIAYIPKINLDLDNAELWLEIDKFCQARHVIFLKIEPDRFSEQKNKNVVSPGFIPGKPIQPGNTIIVDLAGNEDYWLERMKPKTRYNIRLAKKKEIFVEISNDVNTFFELIKETGKRDNFGVHTKEYYQLAYDLFTKKNQVALLIAKYKQTPLAGLMVFRQGNRSWYFYGASNNQERNRMPTYLIQFEALRWAKSQGCETYDLWGIPDEDEQILERDFEQKSEGLWGVYRFKRGFGGEVKRSAAALDRIYNPFLYRLIGIYQKYRGSLT